MNILAIMSIASIAKSEIIEIIVIKKMKVIFDKMFLIGKVATFIILMILILLMILYTFYIGFKVIRENEDK